MLISHFVTNLQTDLAKLGELGGSELSSTSSRLADALEPAIRGRLLEAVNQILAEANQTNTSLHLELRLAGDELCFVRNEPSVETSEVVQDLNARFALRLPEELKALIDDHANRAGASTNSWIVRALSRELGENFGKNVNKVGRNLKGSGHS